MPAQQAVAAEPKRLVHSHPNDEKYWYACKACRADDRARSDPKFKQIADDDLERTTFLVPDVEYDRAVCQAYIASKYPDARWIASSLDLAKLGGWGDDEQIVVVRRDTWPKRPGPAYKRMKDEEGKWVTDYVQPETYISECVETEAFTMRSTIVFTKADRFSKSQLDIAPFITRLQDLWPLPYRIDLPQHPNDSVVRFVYA